ncbi:BrnA antitoxin family protein [Rhodopseudomonas sp.]|uniref:BrnA antitoxin family protein n=1 Tax=Rhodopseudomonas sp. TaxID=1078 RepID=UPI0039E324B5
MTDDPDDAPELLDEFFRTGEVRVDGKVVRRGRPPLGAQPKSSVTLRLDADVLDAYRALGRGWQSQINADLRRVRKLKKA